MKLRPYQQEMVNRLVASPRLMNGDEMRLGKTACGIVAAEQVVRKDAPRLVLCPAIGVAHWHAQLLEWAPETHHHWTVRSYEWWRRHPDQQSVPDVVILDEAHRLKTPTALQTHAVYGQRVAGTWLKQVPYVWPMSGTFVPNHAGELWTHFHALFGESLEHWRWLERYCIVTPTDFGPKIVGNNAEHLEELRAKIKRVLFRRTQKDVWGQLPRLNWNVQEISARLELLRDVQREEDRCASPSLLEIDAEAMDAVPLSTLRRLTGMAKAEAGADFVADLLLQGRRKILVGAWHHNVMERLQQRLWQKHQLTSFAIHGGTSKTLAGNRIEAFQTADNPVILVGQIQTLGEVVCLDQADHVVMVETSWVPGQDLQFAMRAVGVEPTSTPVDILALERTLDTAVARTKVRKRRMQHELSLL